MTVIYAKSYFKCVILFRTVRDASACHGLTNNKKVYLPAEIVISPGVLYTYLKLTSSKKKKKNRNVFKKNIKQSTFVELIFYRSFLDDYKNVSKTMFSKR